MSQRTKFSESYGLIVKTKCGRVVVIRRKVPYCVQNYFIYLHSLYKKNKLKFDSAHCQFNDIRDRFEKDYLPYVSKSDNLDYERFLTNQVYEDLYDFPHGQIHKKKMKNDYYQLFLTAYREFREESGYRFSFKREDVEKYPLIRLQFIGCDGNLYTQYFFIVNNVYGLRRYSYFDSFPSQSTAAIKIQSWQDDRLTYRGELIRLEVAYLKFWQQQSIKHDSKYLLCNDKLDPNIYFVTNN